MESVFADNADIGHSYMREIFTSFNFTINRVISANDLFLMKRVHAIFAPPAHYIILNKYSASVLSYVFTE